MKVGDKVVCLKNKWEDAQGDPQPIKDQVYIISKIYRGSQILDLNARANEVYLEFKEFPDAVWLNIHFRKLDYDFVNQVIANLKEEPVTI